MARPWRRTRRKMESESTRHAEAPDDIDDIIEMKRIALQLTISGVELHRGSGALARFWLFLADFMQTDGVVIQL